MARVNGASCFVGGGSYICCHHCTSRNINSMVFFILLGLPCSLVYCVATSTTTRLSISFPFTRFPFFVCYFHFSAFYSILARFPEFETDKLNGFSLAANRFLIEFLPFAFAMTDVNEAKFAQTFCNNAISSGSFDSLCRI